MTTTNNANTLYVGGLPEEVDEPSLYELLSDAGTITSIHVCRDNITRKSLGYAYVNFPSSQEAEKVKEKYNFTLIQDRPIRIMTSNRDPSSRKSGVGNLIVKNLTPDINEKTLHEIFSSFGPIESCKVSFSNKNGERVSNEYGYVQFATEEAAENAIKKLNGKLLNERKLQVSHFVSRSSRANKGMDSFTNVYIKNLPLSYDKTRLEELFAPFGTIQNATVMTDDEGKSKGFGFVNFNDAEAATKAIEALNGKKADDEENPEKTFFVSRAEGKDERRRKLTMEHQARASQKQETTLYVKNLPDDLDEDGLKDLFKKFGEITSVRIMRDSKKKFSRGFGFVCFANAEDASKAIVEMHNTMFREKPLYVVLHQSKEVRELQKRKLAREQPMAPMMMMPNYGQYPYPVAYPHPQVTWPSHMQPPAIISPEDKKQQIGNQLYQLVYSSDPENASKITGMFLELDEAELNELLQGGDKLQLRIQEAISVLKASS